MLPPLPTSNRLLAIAKPLVLPAQKPPNPPIGRVKLSRMPVEGKAFGLGVAVGETDVAVAVGVVDGSGSVAVGVEVMTVVVAVGGIGVTVGV